LRLHNKENCAAAASGTGGRIVFVSATYFETGLALQTHEVVSKVGVNALSNTLAIEMGLLGVTPNVIAPGPIKKTEGVDGLTLASDANKDTPSPIPLGRQGSVKDIADTAI
jgi:peroxisomal 2,4-dienoyl-CoA reductase